MPTTNEPRSIPSTRIKATKLPVPKSIPSTRIKTTKLPVPKSTGSKRMNATRFLEPRLMKSPGEKATRLFWYVLQQQVRKKRQRPHSSSNTSPAPQQSTHQKTMLARVLSNEQVVDMPQLDREPLDVTQRVVQAKAVPEGSISRAVRLGLEVVLFEEEAKRRYQRARDLSPNYKRKRRD